ncbi:MAG: type II toxin-antitoxin system HicB family antitoxin [Planctomycetes bacterium]|nr:type II toxin-antitoxin system HicB family antitoxin [Planctomycetota bacterium]
MRFEGRVWRHGKHWLIEVPILDVMTQGRTRKEALAMIKDAIEALVNREAFEVDVYVGKGDRFEVGSRATPPLLALLVKRQRQMHGLSLADAARRLGRTSRNTFARYEQGKTVPTVEKLAELLAAVDPEHDLVLTRSRG